MEFKLNIKEECKDNMWPNQWKEIVQLKKELEQLISVVLEDMDDSKREDLIKWIKQIEEYINKEICEDFGWGADRAIRVLREKVEIYKSLLKLESNLS